MLLGTGPHGLAGSRRRGAVRRAWRCRAKKPPCRRPSANSFLWGHTRQSGAPKIVAMPEFPGYRNGASLLPRADWHSDLGPARHRELLRSCRTSRSCTPERSEASGRPRCRNMPSSFAEDCSELWATGCSFLSATQGGPLRAGLRREWSVTTTGFPRPSSRIIYKDCIERPGCKDLIGLFVQPHEEERCTVHSFCAAVRRQEQQHAYSCTFYHEIFAQGPFGPDSPAPEEAADPSTAGNTDPVGRKPRSPTRRWPRQIGAFNFGLERTPGITLFDQTVR